MESLAGPEKVFYYDQFSKCECRISSEVDKDFEVENMWLAQAAAEAEERDRQEAECAFGISNDLVEVESPMNSSLLNISLNDSEAVRNTVELNDIGIQTEPVVLEQPMIRLNKKLCTDEIKAACATVSIRCDISVENAQIAFETVMKTLYNHYVYHSLEEYRATLNKDTIITDEPPAKQKVPTSKNDYNHYAYVLPYARTISNTSICKLPK